MTTLLTGSGLEGRSIITKGMIERMLGIDVPSELAAIRARDEALYTRTGQKINRTQTGTLDFASEG